MCITLKCGPPGARGTGSGINLAGPSASGPGVDRIYSDALAAFKAGGIFPDMSVLPLAVQPVGGSAVEYLPDDEVYLYLTFHIRYMHRNQKKTPFFLVLGSPKTPETIYIYIRNTLECEDY